MKKAKELNEEFNKLFEKMPIWEMSGVWKYRDKKNSVSVWTENPMVVDNMYFKYYDNFSYQLASKVARIRIDKPEYVGGNHKESNNAGRLQKWELSKSDVKVLMELLQSPSKDHPGYNKWQDIIIQFNHANFGLSLKEMEAGDYGQEEKDPILPDSVHSFKLDTPIPDYTELVR